MSDVQKILESLLLRTQRSELKWSADAKLTDARHPLDVTDGRDAEPKSVVVSAFVCTFPQSRIRIRMYEVNGAPDLAIVQIELISGEVVTEWRLAAGAVEWDVMVPLWSAAKAQVMSTVVDELLGEPVTPTVSVEDRRQQFLQLVAGQWRLEYQSGPRWCPEELRIDIHGNYYAKHKGDQPYFTLRNIYYDPIGHNVTFEKVEAAGPKKGDLRQVEVLRVDPQGQWMKGYAQEDAHGLRYERIPVTDQ